VLGQGGIGDGWQTGGLNASTRLECIADAPSACSDGCCATVWMQSRECAVFNATHVGLIGKKLQPAVAQLNISVAARSLMERLYSFLLHVPVWNGSGWQFASIDARLDVHAVADAQQSEVRVGSASDPSRPGRAAVVVNHLEKVAAEIVARDVDGTLINRTGEAITVRVVGSDRTADLTELAQFDATRGVYFVSTAIGTPGEYVVLLDTDAYTPASSKASIRVICADGYTELHHVCSQTDATRKIILGCIFGALVLGFLGLLVHMIRVHRDRWRAFLLSFLIHEGVVALDILFELWDVSGDIFAFVTMKDSGNTDLFIAFAVFLVPSTVFSAGSVVLKLLLLKRRATPRAPRRPSHAAGRMDFRLLCEVFMLRGSEQRHEERKSANDAACYMAYSYILLALTEVWVQGCRVWGFVLREHAVCRMRRSASSTRSCSIAPFSTGITRCCSQSNGCAPRNTRRTFFCCCWSCSHRWVRSSTRSYSCKSSHSCGRPADNSVSRRRA
jgi:hypothetical protein